MDGQLKRGMLDVCVLAAIRKEDSYGYQILRGERVPGRDILLRTALSLGLSLKETHGGDAHRAHSGTQRPSAQILSSHAAGPRAHRAIQNRMGADREHLPIHSVNGGD